MALPKQPHLAKPAGGSSEEDRIARRHPVRPFDELGAYFGSRSIPQGWGWPSRTSAAPGEEPGMLSIRPGLPSDIPALVRLWYAMLEECGLLGSGVVDDWEARLAEHFERQMSGGHARWYIAQDGSGRIAGTAAAFLSSGRSNILKDLTATLAGIYVEPEFRKRGVARDLTRLAIAWCKERGCTRVRLTASADGRPLYESLGFVPATEMMRLDL